MEQTGNLDHVKLVNDLQIVRNNFDIKELRSRVKKRGDLSKVSREFNIERDTLSRAIQERRILFFFSGLLKSKAQLLSTIKLDRELILFAKLHNLNFLSVRELRKRIKAWRKTLEENPRILLSNLQHDLIIGSTFGDASIRQREKNCNFRVGHSICQKEYLFWKYKILEDFILLKPHKYYKEIRGHPLTTFDISTFTHYVFNYYRKLFYKRGIKIITREALDLLNPRSLSIWVCDDGSYDTRQGYIVLCTNAFTLKEHKIMKRYFEDVFGLSPTIGFRDNKYYYLRFKQADSKKLIEIIRPFIPESMKYKIGEENGTSRI